MAATFKVADFLVTAKDLLSTDETDVLVYAVCKARAFIDDAFLQTIQAVQIEAACSTRDEAVTHLPWEFLIHVKANFRTKTSDETFTALHRLQGLLLKLTGNLRSPDLHFKEWGLEYFEPTTSGNAPVKGYVKTTLSQKVEIIKTALQGGSGKCLNVDLTTLQNDSKIYLDFRQLKLHSHEDVTDTVIHESTHKYLASLDNTLDCPWKRAAEYFEDWRRIGVDPPINQVWTSLDREEALQNAYSLANYIHYMPSVDLMAYHRQINDQDRVIGRLASNQRVFSSISNDDL